MIPATYDFMADATLSVFVDESGRFQLPDESSQYYIVSLVLHDQRIPIDGLVAGGARNFRNNYLRFVKLKEIE